MRHRQLKFPAHLRKGIRLEHSTTQADKRRSQSRCELGHLDHVERRSCSTNTAPWTSWPPPASAQSMIVKERIGYGRELLAQSARSDQGGHSLPLVPAKPHARHPAIVTAAAAVGDWIGRMQARSKRTRGILSRASGTLIDHQDMRRRTNAPRIRRSGIAAGHPAAIHAGRQRTWRLLSSQFHSSTISKPHSLISDRKAW